MEKIQFLTIGRDPVILQHLSAFINENPKWESTATVDDETAIEIFHQRKYDIIILVEPLEEVSQKKFRTVFGFQHPEVGFIRHFGNSTGLLASEIQEALDQNKHQLNVIDDVFKNPGPDTN